MGTWLFSPVVTGRLRSGCLRRPRLCRRSSRSMVEGLTCSKRLLTCSDSRSSPWRSRAARSSGMTAAKSLPHIRSPTSHSFTKAAVTSGP